MLISEGFAVRRSPLLVSTPLLLAFGMAALSVATTPVRASSDMDVGRTIARAQGLDRKCGFLQGTERDALSNLAASAEISLAEAYSVKEAQAALALGRNAAKDAACDEQARQFVTEITAKASAGEAVPADPEPLPGSAVIAAPVETVQQTQDSSALLHPAQDIASDDRDDEDSIFGTSDAQVDQPVDRAPPKLKPALALETRPGSKPSKPAAGKTKRQNYTLARYASVAERYYVELRCRTMSGAAIRQLYANVLASHKAAAAENARVDVRTALQSAESRAGSRSCG